MARLTRVTNKIFGSTASTTGDPSTGPEIGQFGSALSGDYIATDDVANIQALPAYDKGWIGSVIPSQQYPTLPEMTGVMKVMSYQTGYLMQEGIPEWDTNTTYYKGSLVKFINGDDINIYQSLIDDNNALITDTNSWTLWLFANPNLNNLTQDGYTKLNCYPATCVNGKINTSTGYPDLLINNSTSVGFKVSDFNGSYMPIDVIFPTGEPKRFTTLSSYNMTGKASGTYNLYIDKEGTIRAFKNNNYSSRKTPGGGTINVRYETRTRYYDVSFTRPNLSSNGTMGGNSFACEGAANSSSPAWKAFDDDTSSTGWVSNTTNTGSITFYSPTPLKISNLTLKGYATNVNTRVPKNGIIYASNTNDNFVQVGSFSNNTSKVFSVSCNTNNNYYKYYKISITANTNSGYAPGLYDIAINAVYQQSETYQEKIVEVVGSSLATNDVWLDTSTKPYTMYQYDGADFNQVEWVRIPQQVVWGGSAITSFKVARSYNANGWDEELSTPDLERPTTLTSGVQFTAPYSGWVLNYSLAQSYYLERGFTYTPNSSGYTFYPIKGV